MVERDIYEVANQLGGYIDEATPAPLATFLRRESREAAKLAARIAELEAENERLRESREYWQRTANIWSRRAEAFESLSRTGAVKVKALEWSPVEEWKECSRERAPAFGGEYQIVMLDPGEGELPSLYFEIGLGAFMFRFEQDQDPMGLPGETSPKKFPSVNAAKAAAQADYERRILSALEPAAPEGEQEAARIGDAVLAWMTKYDLLDGEQEYYVADVIAVLDDLTPLTRPAEQAVTEALRDLLDHVDRNTCAHEDTYRGGSIWTICDSCGQKWADDRGGFSHYSDPEPVAKARAALKAAMEAGRHE